MFGGFSLFADERCLLFVNKYILTEKREKCIFAFVRVKFAINACTAMPFTWHRTPIYLCAAYMFISSSVSCPPINQEVGAYK